MKKVFLVLTTISLFLFSCKKNDGPAKLGITDVYVAGKDFNSVVALWHNGQQLFWEGTYGWTGDAYGVTIQDTNVYVAGNRDNRALYWKNGEEVYLSDPETETAVARSIFFAGSDMYIAGTRLVLSNAYQAGYWKNGVFNILYNVPYKNAECRDIAVMNNTVHAVGYADLSPTGSGGDIAAIYWKNGDTTILARGGFPLLNAIRLIGDDVYITGRNTYNGAYWKNGVAHDLGQYTEAQDIDVLNGDVYVVGYEYFNGQTAVYWKNGEKVELGNGIATGIQIVDGDVYIAGYVDIDNVSTAVYWKNGVRNTAGVSSSPGLGVATSGIGVMKR
jgi:hypothetical protein